MKVLLDLNVLLDVVQNRVPYYQDSAKVLSLAKLGEIQAVLRVHAFTTLYYILAKAVGKPKADQTIDWLLANFDVAVADKAVLRRARQLAFPDFEDAVVASLAEAGQCDRIITRNVSDLPVRPFGRSRRRTFSVPLLTRCLIPRKGLRFRGACRLQRRDPHSEEWATSPPNRPLV
jgi:predicted nucleic acid-binding protein